MRPNGETILNNWIDKSGGFSTMITAVDGHFCEECGAEISALEFEANGGLCEVCIGLGQFE